MVKDHGEQPTGTAHIMYSASTIIAVVFLSLFGCIERINFTPLEEEPLPPMLTPSEPVLRFPRNNSYLGSVHTGALRPMFQWEASAWSGQGLVLYELQISNDPTFETEVTVVKTSGTSHQPISNLLVSLVPPVGARYFWRVKACVEDACSEPSPRWWVNLGRVQRDVNGDGYADVVVVGGSTSQVTNDGGQLYLFLGGPGSGFNNQYDSRLAGSGETWFRDPASIGDMDGDGFSDLAVRVSKIDGTAPRVLIYRGGGGSVLESTPDYDLPARDCAAAGDVNGDGFDDLVVTGSDGSNSLFLGTNDGHEPVQFPTGDYAQYNPAGDVNGDGFADLLRASGGVVDVLLGAASMPLDFNTDGNLRGGTADGFGRVASAAGDINGDGFGDILLGAPHDGTNGEYSGRAYAYLGGAGSSFDTSPDGVFSGQAAFEKFGIDTVALGDLNKDGFDDFGISSMSQVEPSPLRGSLQIYFGGEGLVVDTSYETKLLGEAESNFFGNGTTFGDVNGDGFDDLMTGAKGYDYRVGRAYVFMGGPGRNLDPYPDGYLRGLTNHENFGEVANQNTRFFVFL